LGRAYSLSGEVVKGDGLGKKIGYPTANLKVGNPLKLIPADGVYAVIAVLEGVEYKGMMNIGIRPTVNENADSSNKKLEINIFDFDQDIYGQIVKVNTISRIRDEVKFESVESLAAQLADDKEAAKALLS